MSAAAALIAVAVVAVVTYLARAGLILALADRELPAPILRALRQVGPAVLAALAINLMFGGEGESTAAVPEVAALVSAGVVAWWRRSLLLSLAAGMLTLWILDAAM